LGCPFSFFLYRNKSLPNSTLAHSRQAQKKSVFRNYLTRLPPGRPRESVRSDLFDLRVYPPYLHSSPLTLTARPCGAPASLFALGNSQVALLNPIPIIRPHAGCASELSPALGVRLPTALQVLQVLFLEIGIKWGPFQGEQATNAEILRISQPLPLQKGVGGHFIMNEARSQSGMSSSRIIRWLVVQESSFVAIGHAQQARTCANKVVFPRKESL